METLIKSLERLIEQSTEVLGPEDAVHAHVEAAAGRRPGQPGQGKAPKVFWMQAAPAGPGPDETKG